MSNFEPMLACQIQFDKIEQKAGQYFMEPKLDGVRCIADVRDPDRVRLTSRGGKDLTAKLPHIVKELQDSYEGLILDGELGYMDNRYRVDFNTTMRVLGSGIAVALGKQNHPSFADRMIAYNVFDLLWVSRNGQLRLYNNSYNDRRRALERYYVQSDNIDLVPVLRTSWDVEPLVQIVEEFDGEGVILKNPAAPYCIGQRRANTWYKVKKYDTIDARIIGFTLGQGKYDGMVGAIEFEAADGSRGKCSGMDDATRNELTLNMQQNIGRWFELRFFDRVGKDKKGLRFPQFIRFREDKDNVPQEMDTDGEVPANG